MDKLLVILGPTATGKTNLAIFLAKKFNGELVSCDSRQIYVGLDVGTGKMPGIELSNKNKELSLKKKKNFWKIDGVKIWMYDVLDPKKQYTVADYVKDAEKIISGITERGRLPIVVGGAGLYLKALLEGLDSLSVPVDKKLRKSLEKLPLNQLQERLQQVPIERWEDMNKSDRENPRRLVRAIELKISPRRSPFGHLRGVARNFNVFKIGLTASREILYRRVDESVVNRINQGMVEEAKRLHKSGLTFKRMRQLGLEYGVLADYLEGKINNIDGLIKVMQGRIHGYVRRQLTWFKNPSTSSGHIYWFDITQKNFPDDVEKIITKWYHQAHATKD